MIYHLQSNLQKHTSDIIIATSLNGVVYSENSRLHVKTNTRHIIYKFDGTPIGWYSRNLKTCDDIYLGEEVEPIIELENLQVKNTIVWNSLHKQLPK